MRFLLVVAFLGFCASAARADGTDPVVRTLGCGGIGQPRCATVLLTPGNTSVTVNETFSCDLTGCTAMEDVINMTDTAITSFSLVFANPDSLGRTLSYSCADSESNSLFSCSGGPTALFFTGASLCADPDADLTEEDGGTFTPDGDECGVIIALSASLSEGITTGESVSATFSTSTPEPSTALLLLFGLMGGGLVSFKSLRKVLA